MAQSILLLVLSFLTLFFQKNEKKEITFLSQDNLVITADLYVAKATSKPILLCHQAEFSRGEYLEIAPELVKSGFTCLAIDQRSGKECKGIKNKTNEEAIKKKLKTNFLDAQKDIEASIDYMYERFQQPVIVFGSSYSASLALRIASESKKVRAVIAFSPGEFFTEQFSVLESCASIKQPVFITGSKDEVMQLKDYLNDSPSRTKQIFIPNSKGTHGAKVLWTNSSDKLEYWQALKEFLAKVQKY
ncbi:MAG: alpha/beta hydrolase [Bacteroidota bacterium]|jgi:pimeloyl-ACP methyl ester carboxylesterase